MSTLNRLWQALEQIPGLEASCWEWRRRLGPEHGFATRFLRTTEELAGCLPIGNGAPHQIVIHSEKSVLAVAPDDGTTTALAIADVAVQTLHAGALRKGLASALALRTATTPIERRDEFRVGAWQPQPSTSFPVQFLARSDADSYAKQIGLLADSSVGAAIVLVPTLDHCGDEIVSMAKGRSLLLVPLIECVRVEAESLVAEDSWPEHLGAFCQLAGVSLPSPFSNKRSKRKRATRAADIESLRKELIEEVRSRREALRHAESAGLDLQLLRRPQRAEIGARAGLKPYTVTRCFADADAGDLVRLYDMLESVEDVLRYGR